VTHSFPDKRNSVTETAFSADCCEEAAISGNIFIILSTAEYKKILVKNVGLWYLFFRETCICGSAARFAVT